MGILISIVLAWPGSISGATFEVDAARRPESDAAPPEIRGPSMRNLVAEPCPHHLTVPQPEPCDFTADILEDLDEVP